MRHGKVTRNLGVKTGHRVALLRNLLKGLTRDGRIRTTTARAKVLRPYVEKIITRLKDPTVANLRLAYAEINDRDVVHELAHEVAPKFASRPGGYLRIMKLARARPGDNADMSLVEWCDEGLVEAALERRALISAGKKEDKTAKPSAKKAASAKADKKSAKKTDTADNSGPEDKGHTEKKAKKSSASTKKAKKSA